MSTGLQITIAILVVLLAAVIALYFFGKRAEKRQAESKEQMDAMAQTISMLVIDKKRLRLSKAGLPAIVMEKTPFYLRYSKVPIVKAKVGPKVMTMMCDAKVYDIIPVKKEVKAVVSGIYITSVKGLRGPIDTPAPKKKWYQFKK